MVKVAGLAKSPEAVFYKPSAVLFLDKVRGVMTPKEAWELLDALISQYSMSENEVAYCLLLRECNIEDFKSLQYLVSREDVYQAILIHEKYHNELTYEALRGALEGRAWMWHCILKDTLNLPKYNFVWVDWDREKSDILYYRGRYQLSYKASFDEITKNPEVEFYPAAYTDEAYLSFDEGASIIYKEDDGISIDMEEIFIIE